MPMQIPKNLGGMAGETDPLAGMLIIEQLGYADAGLAISLGVSVRTFDLAAIVSRARHPATGQGFL